MKNKLMSSDETKERIRKSSLIYYAENRDLILKKNKERYYLNKTENKGIFSEEKKLSCSNKTKAFRVENYDMIRSKEIIRDKIYKEKNRQILKEKSINYYHRIKNNPLYLEKIKLIKAKSTEKNKTKILERKRIYHLETYNRNKDIINSNKRILYKKRKETDILFNVKLRFRSRLRHAFDRIKLNKPFKAEELLGANWIICKSHIESLFCEGMNWDNRNLWHIDHIMPFASAKNEEDVIKLCNYKNLQPLWAKENIKKGAKIL